MGRCVQQGRQPGGLRLGRQELARLQHSGLTSLKSSRTCFFRSPGFFVSHILLIKLLLPPHSSFGIHTLDQTFSRHGKLPFQGNTETSLSRRVGIVWRSSSEVLGHCRCCLSSRATIFRTFLDLFKHKFHYMKLWVIARK